MKEDVDLKNRKLARTLLIVVVAMFGFGFALVPLYDVLCDITGINGKGAGKSAANATYEIDKKRVVNVEFMTSVNGSTPMKFYAETASVKTHPGEFQRINFTAENLTDKTLVAQAIPSISPGLAAEYLKKTECFCFTEQVFKPRESRSMPVRFVMDPALPNEYKTITLAYTFFEKTDNTHKN